MAARLANMNITLNELAKVIDGQWLGAPANFEAQLEMECSGVSIDTRTLDRGQIFFAIEGERFDGHDFVEQAFVAGAAVAVVMREMENAADLGGPVLCVADTVQALQRLAADHRRRLREAGRCAVIGVAGSNGKTTTRHLIHHVLSAELVGIQSPKSFNNHLGVPLTLLTAEPEHDFAVVEIGTNHPGEMAALAKLVQPDIAVVTSIGEEHLEFFGDLIGVAREEFDILNHLATHGVGFVPVRSHLPKEVELETHLPKDMADVRQVSCQESARAVALPGEHNRLNASFAIAIAQRLGLADEVIQQRLQTVQPVEMRSVIRTLGQGERSITLINDAYNANPSSMRAALGVLAQAPAKRRIAILGDMFELGLQASSLHAQLGRAVADLHDANHPRQPAVDMGIFIGRLSQQAAEAMRQARGGMTDAVCHVQNLDDAKTLEMLAARIEPGDAVLLKASRGMRLERLVPAIEARVRMFVV